MMCRRKVFRRVGILRRIATAHVAADCAHSKMNPHIACLKTFLATLSLGFHIPLFGDMWACFRVHIGSHSAVCLLIDGVSNVNTAGES